MSRRDWLSMSGLLGLGLALRVPFRSEYAWHWDGAQFALAVLQFDPAAGLPQAPGFPLYVFLGKCLNFFVGDPHAALVWLSVMCGALLPVLGFQLGSALYGRVAGWGTAVVVLTSPLCWFHSEVALTNIVDATLVTALLLVSERALRWPVRWPVVVGLNLLFVALGGVRLQTAFALMPFWIWLAWRLKRWPVRVAMLGAVLVLAAWAATQFELLWLKARYDTPKTLWGGGGWDSIKTMAWGGWLGLLLATPLALLGLRRANALVWWWLVPLILFGVVAYTTMPGYVLSYLPALAVLVGAGLTRLRSPLAGMVAVAGVNLVVFLGTSYGLTASLIGQHDRVLANCFADIRAKYPPDSTVIYHRGEWFFFGFRQFQYHLPEYHNVLLTPDASLPGARGRQMWVGFDRQTNFTDAAPVAEHIAEVDGEKERVRER